MPLIVDGTTGVTFNDASLQGAAASPFGLKNRIINGDMVVSQRHGTSSVTPAINTGTYTVDRFYCIPTQASRLTIQQNAGGVTPPAGFTNYLGITSTSAYTPISTDSFLLAQAIEGFNTADLAFGTANARTITLSFWVRSSLTGTFGGSVENFTETQSYPFSYTISSANTWTQVSITIPGSTTGSWLTNNSVGMYVIWDLGSGSNQKGTANAWGTTPKYAPTGTVNLISTNGATLYITGVQLERNTTATPFEWIPYGMELALCQRYCVRFGPNSSEYFGYAYQTNASVINVVFPVTMRTNPSVLVTGTWDGRNAINAVSTATVSANAQDILSACLVVAFTATAGTPTRILSNNSGAITFSAEL
jgi:hypothetical protein